VPLAGPPVAAPAALPSSSGSPAPAASGPPEPQPPVEEDREIELTIGMATYDDFDGVYFTVQALRPGGGATGKGPGRGHTGGHWRRYSTGHGSAPSGGGRHPRCQGRPGLSPGRDLDIPPTAGQRPPAGAHVRCRMTRRLSPLAHRHITPLTPTESP
jgi:hypothetical protein